MLCVIVTRVPMSRQPYTVAASPAERRSPICISRLSPLQVGVALCTVRGFSVSGG